MVRLGMANRHPAQFKISHYTTLARGKTTPPCWRKRNPTVKLESTQRKILGRKNFTARSELKLKSFCNGRFLIFPQLQVRAAFEH